VGHVVRCHKVFSVEHAICHYRRIEGRRDPKRRERSF
jgi:hypothetical protein